METSNSAKERNAELDCGNVLGRISYVGIRGKKRDREK